MLAALRRGGACFKFSLSMLGDAQAAMSSSPRSKHRACSWTRRTLLLRRRHGRGQLEFARGLHEETQSITAKRIVAHLGAAADVPAQRRLRDGVRPHRRAFGEAELARDRDASARKFWPLLWSLYVVTVRVPMSLAGREREIERDLAELFILSLL